MGHPWRPPAKAPDRFTRGRSLVRSQVRPPGKALETGPFCRRGGQQIGNLQAVLQARLISARSRELRFRAGYEARSVLPRRRHSGHSPDTPGRRTRNCGFGWASPDAPFRADSFCAPLSSLAPPHEAPNWPPDTPGVLVLRWRWRSSDPGPRRTISSGSDTRPVWRVT